MKYFPRQWIFMIDNEFNWNENNGNEVQIRFYMFVEMIPVESSGEQCRAGLASIELHHREKQLFANGRTHQYIANDAVICKNYIKKISLY